MTKQRRKSTTPTSTTASSTGGVLALARHCAHGLTYTSQGLLLSPLHRQNHWHCRLRPSPSHCSAFWGNLWKVLLETPEGPGAPVLPDTSLCKGSVLPPFEVWWVTFISSLCISKGPAAVPPLLLGLPVMAQEPCSAPAVLPVSVAASPLGELGSDCSFALPFLDFHLI